MRPALAVLLAAAVTAIAFYVATFSTFDDFRAFYCAGAAARAGSDPYAAQPLHHCELSLMPAALRAHWRDVVVPAPLPPYAMTLFAAISVLPFGAAALLWTVASLLAITVTVLALRDMTRLPAAAILLLIALPVFGASIMLGQTVPVVIAAVCLCAWCVTRGSATGAALAAAIALLDPRVGLAVCVSLACWVPALRMRLLIAVAAVAAASLAFGIDLNREYLTAVLPAHGLSEAASFEQYSLTAVLLALGVPLSTAAIGGSISFFAMLCLGVGMARTLAARFAHLGFLVLVPAAFAVIGGPFVHLTQIAAAIPAALLVLSKSGRYRSIALAATLLLALPWPMAKSAAFVYMAPLLVFAALWWLSERSEYVAPLAFAAAAAIASFTLHYGYTIESQAGVPVRHAREPHIAPYFAEATWSHLMWTGNSNDDALSWAKRIPTWCGLLLLVALTLEAPKKRTVLAKTC